jgi:aminoglycoside 3-N-acetyltransferase
MSELEAIQKASYPITRQIVAEDLRSLGLKRGMTVIVHSSLSALGWVNGGPVAVIQALMDVLTGAGTLVMPTHSSDLSEPSEWSNPPVPKSWHAIIRETMPCYDPRLTPTRGMGRIPELFRTWPDVRRSDHPQMSFAAWGKEAVFVTTGHRLKNSMGETSPLARIYDLDGYVLLLGVGYGNNTSFHLAEYRVPNPPQMMEGAPVWENGRSTWKTFSDVETDADVFPAIGSAFEKAYGVSLGKVGLADCRFFAQRPAVDFAEKWIDDYRQVGRGR